jgi:hypothetical protein
MMKYIDKKIEVLVILFILAITVSSYFTGWQHAMRQPADTWHCIEPAEGIGWAMFCEVGSCNVLFYGDDFVMECE